MLILAWLCFTLAALALFAMALDARRRTCSVCVRSWAIFTAGRDDDRCHRHRVRRTT